MGAVASPFLLFFVGLSSVASRRLHAIHTKVKVYKSAASSPYGRALADKNTGADRLKRLQPLDERCSAFPAAGSERAGNRAGRALLTAGALRAARAAYGTRRAVPSDHLGFVCDSSVAAAQCKSIETGGTASPTPKNNARTSGRVHRKCGLQYRKAGGFSLVLTRFSSFSYSLEEKFEKGFAKSDKVPTPTTLRVGWWDQMAEATRF